MGKYDINVKRLALLLLPTFWRKPGFAALAYAAVCRSGLSFNKQLWLRPEIVPGLRDITDAVHREGLAPPSTIGHCGNMTHWTTAGQMPIGASSGFNLYAYTPCGA